MEWDWGPAALQNMYLRSKYPKEEEFLETAIGTREERKKYYGAEVAEAAGKAEEESFLDKINIFKPSREDLEKKKKLEEELLQASQNPTYTGSLTIDDFKFNQDNYDKNKVIKGITSGILTIEPNEFGGYDIYRVQAYDLQGKPIRETKPIALTTNKGELKPYEYLAKKIEPIAPGIFGDILPSKKEVKKLSHYEVEATARGDLRKLSNQNVAGKYAFRMPFESVGESLRSIITGKKSTLNEYGNKGLPGSTYEITKSYGKAGGRMIEGLGTAAILGLLTKGASVHPAVIGGIIGAANIPDYLSEAALGLDTYPSAFAKSLMDVGMGAATMGLYGRMLKNTPNVIATGISQGKQPYVIAAKQMAKLMGGQSILNAGNVLSNMAVDVMAKNRNIDTETFLKEFVVNSGITIGTNLILEFTPFFGSLKSYRGYAKQGSEFVHAINLLKEMTPEQRTKIEKLWNYVAENHDKINTNLTSDKILERLGQEAAKTGIIEKWDNELIKQMKLAGYIKGPKEAKHAKEFIETVRDMHTALNESGENIKVKYSAENNKFIIEPQQRAIAGEVIEGLRAETPRPVVEERKEVPRVITEEDELRIKENIESSMAGMTKEQKGKFLNKLVENNLAIKKEDGKVDFKGRTRDIYDVLQRFQEGESIARVMHNVAEPIYHDASNPTWMKSHEALVEKAQLDPEDNINLIVARNELGAFYDDAKSEIRTRIERATGSTPTNATVERIMSKIYGLGDAEGGMRQRFIEKYSQVKDNSYQGPSQETLLKKFNDYITGNRETTINAEESFAKKYPTYEDFINARSAEEGQSPFYKDLEEITNAEVKSEPALSEYAKERILTPEESARIEQYPILENIRAKETGTIYPVESLEEVQARKRRVEDIYNKIDQQLKEVEKEEKIPTKKQVEDERIASAKTQKWLEKTKTSENTGFTKLKNIANKKIGKKTEDKTKKSPLEEQEEKLVYKEPVVSNEEKEAIIKDEPKAVENEKIENEVNKQLVNEAEKYADEIQKKTKKVAINKLKNNAQQKATIKQTKETTETAANKEDIKELESQKKIKKIEKQIEKQISKLDDKLDEIETKANIKRKERYAKIQEKNENILEKYKIAEEEYNKTKQEFIDKGIIDSQGVLIGGGAKEENKWNKVYNNYKKYKALASMITENPIISIKANKGPLLSTIGLIATEEIPDDDDASELREIGKAAVLFGLAGSIKYGSAKHGFIKNISANVAEKIGFRSPALSREPMERIRTSPMFKEWMTKGVWQKDGTYKKLANEAEAMEYAAKVYKMLNQQAEKGVTVLHKKKNEIIGYEARAKDNNNPLEKDYYEHVAIAGAKGKNIFNEKFKRDIDNKVVEFQRNVKNSKDANKIIRVNINIFRKIKDIDLAMRGGDITEETAIELKKALTSEESIKREFLALNELPDTYRAAWNKEEVKEQDLDHLYNGYKKWREMQDACYRAVEYGNIADALGVGPDEFNEFRAKARTALEEYAKAKEGLRELRETFKELKKLEPSPESPEFIELFKTAQRIKDLAKKMKIKIDGRDYQQLRTALKWIEHLDDFLENSSLNQYMDLRSTHRGARDEEYNYALKIIEVTRKNPKIEKLTEDIEVLRQREEEPLVARRINQKQLMRDLLEKETEGLRKSGEDFFDVPEYRTNQKVFIKFKKKKQLDNYIQQMLLERNAVPVATTTEEGKITKYNIFEMDAIDDYGRKILDENGNPVRKLYRINDAIDFNAMRFAITSRDALKTMLYRAVKDGSLKSGELKAMDAKLRVIEAGLPNLQQTGDEVAYQNISDAVALLRGLITKNTAPIGLLKEALENLTRYKPPDGYQNKNYRGSDPITADEYSEYIKNIINITQDKALLGLERGLAMKGIDDVLGELLNMGMVNTKVYDDMINFRDYYYQRPLNYAIWDKEARQLAGNMLNAIQRIESAIAMVFNVGTMPANHLYAVKDVIATSNNPLLAGFRFAKNYKKMLTLAYNKGVELSTKQLKLWGVPDDKIDAFKNVLTKEGIRFFGKPELDKNGNLTPEGLQTHIKNQIAEALYLRNIGSETPIQAAFHRDVTKLEDYGYTPTKIIEAVNRFMSAFTAIDDITNKFPYDPKKISLEDYVKWVGDEAQLYSYKTNGAFSPIYNSKIENALLKIPGGRAMVMLSRPFLKSLYNTFELMHIAMHGGVLTDKGKSRIKAINNMLAKSFLGWALGGVSGVTYLVDAIDIADKAMLSINSESEDPTAMKQTFREKLHTWLRDTARSYSKKHGLNITENKLNEMVVMLEKGLPSYFGIGLNIDERTSSFLDPYLLQAIDRQLKAGKDVVTKGLTEESIENFYRAFIPTGIVRTTDVINQLMAGERVGKYAFPIHSETYKELNKLNMPFSFGDALKYFIFGRPAAEKVALQLKYSPIGSRKELISKTGQLDMAEKMLKQPGIEIKGIGINKFNKATKAEYLARNTELKDNAVKLYDEVQKVYNSDEYQNAIKDNQKKLEELIQKNPSIIKQASERTASPVEKYDTKDIEGYISNLKNRINKYYYIDAIHKILKEQGKELMGMNIHVEPLFKGAKMFDYTKGRFVYFDKMDFNERGLHYAVNAIENQYENAMPLTSKQRKRFNAPYVR